MPTFDSQAFPLDPTRLTDATRVVFVFGSENDYLATEKDRARVARLFEVMNLSPDCYDVTVISADRNGQEIDQYAEALSQLKNLRAVIAIAGMSAILPRVLPRKTGFTVPILAVGMPSNGYPDGDDARLTITRVPGGVCPPAYFETLYAAAMFAVQIICVSHDIPEYLGRFQNYMANSPDVVRDALGGLPLY
ncbi:MAG: AIR carboxylase family protein [Patescibacteria group bacterium]